ncbi:hypothetical protein HYE58_01210 [Aggregatibacter actinomycetemcomitans]|nr:hypothetical protein [Aggregatibacter actinomycetemcomitans]
MNFGGDGCNDVVLKIPEAEAVKLYQLAQVSGTSNGGAQEFQYYPEIFAASFSITLGFWLVAKFGGLILDTIKRA